MPLKHVIWLFTIVLFAGLTSSCKRQKLRKSEVLAPKTEIVKEETNETKAIDSVKVEEVAAPIKPLVIVNPDEIAFNYLKIKSKVDFSSSTISQSFPATIHVRKDSIIWVSVTVGLEAARGIITPDSAIFLDRINKNVYRFSFQELSEQFGFDISYSLVQSLIIGNMPIYVRDEDAISENGGFVTVNQKVGVLTIENIIDQLINKLTRVVATSTKNTNRMVITYSDFQQLPEGNIPHKIITIIESQQSETAKNTKVDVEHSKFEFLERDLRFPFNVPKNYNEVKLKK